ncbi:MAG: hypothetical protein KDC54_18420, partial [Lewinella sp.]|nr:hypothetical protein [Lewinella sp.]
LVDGFESIYALDDRHVLIATERGFTNYDPHRGDHRDSLPFNVLIRRVMTLSPRDSLLFSDGLGPGSPDAGLIALRHNFNSLRFTYVAPFFEHLGQIQYRYRLEGYEDEWSDWSYRQEKDLTNLPPGDYLFQVEARNAYGQISEAAAFAFVIRPPWYASSVARGIYILLGIIGLIALFYLYSHRLNRERTAMAQEQAATIARKEAIFREEQEKSEAEIIRLRNENLRADIQHKNAQLASSTMHLVQKSETLQGIKQELEKLLQGKVNSDEKRKIRQLVHTLEDDIRLDNMWEQFDTYFDQVHGNFLQNLREAYPNLTPKDQRLCAYLRMNLSTKEIAPLMNISVRGVEISRYRLRKKLDLDTSTNLTDFLMRF